MASPPLQWRLLSGLPSLTRAAPQSDVITRTHQSEAANGVRIIRDLVESAGRGVAILRVSEKLQGCRLDSRKPSRSPVESLIRC
ncbi:hypothetical protein Pmani_004740 [Petrolisthes manimaculis]|uniref:Uncharacterized protein n=1 Tax=Petrolisthes manimaculis TaxID=1843537 RepID=A0AAE1QG93_9EUCA|nr:hypothetical protein Pmani_004740 [Petrolisthes manimaculis]